MTTTKGIVLAGGTGSRLYPLTIAVNKQLLNLYDKPIIYYPISVLMLAKIKDILIISNSESSKLYNKIFGNGEKLGLKISYEIQEKPNGIAESFLIGEKFINKQPVTLILGDNFFFGQSLSKKLVECTKLNIGAKVFLHPVKKPSLFGVATVNKQNKIIKIVEKPRKTNSNLAVTGLYFFDDKVVNFCKTLKPSKRNELEIVDLLNKYKKSNKLSAEIIGRGGAWLDTGSIESFNDTANFIASIQNRQGFKIGCLEEISFNNGWINKKTIKEAINFYGNCDYSRYLYSILNQ